MATTRKPAKTPATTKKTTTETTSDASTTTTATIKQLQNEIAGLREEVIDLRNTLSSISKTSNVTVATGTSGTEELKTCVIKALRHLGVREWILRDSGLK